MPKPIYHVRFEVEKVTPDPRQYNQQRQVYAPVCSVIEVALEINKENFVLPAKFAQDLILFELGELKKLEVPDLSFTPLGWKRVMDLLEEPYKDNEDETLWEDEEKW